jgi:hypothetical protein
LFEFAPDGALARAIVPARVPRFEPTDVVATRDGKLYVTDAARQTLYAFAFPTEEP